MARTTKINANAQGETKQLKLVRFDWAIKHILRNKANFDILEGFLSELLKKQIKIDGLLDSESNQATADNKFNRVDLLAHTADGEKIIIEVQTASQWDFYHRILFGTSKVIAEHTKIGRAYSTVPKVISVSVLLFNLGGTDYIYKGTTSFIGVHKHDVLNLCDESKALYINEIKKEYDNPSQIYPEYYLIQLNKFADKITDKFDQWVYLLKHESVKPDFDAQGIESAKEKLDVLKLSEPERKAYDKYWQDLSFEASLVETHEVKLRQSRREGIKIGKKEGIDIGKKEGIEIGEKKGEHNAQLKMAQKLLAKGIDEENIAELTGLSIEEIQALKK